MKQQQIPGIGGLLPGELIVDLFAGGGGASAGIEAALGRPPDIAINHDPHAVQMHEANHPATTHYCQSVFHREAHPRELVKGRPVGLLWLSPDCRHFSRAKGSAPVSPTVRGLCWIGLRWAKYARPRVVVLENVPEFLTFGPLDKDNMPVKARAGEYFRAFVKQWERYGYTVAWEKLIAADHGAPTTRKRLFLVARCDGEPITWPEPTNGKTGKPRPWRSAAECIDWSIPCPSIFERKRPLAPATCRRIARGIVRYVLQGKPFIVQVGHGDHVLRPGDRCNSVDDPVGVVSQINNRALVSPTLVQTGYGEREGQAPRCLDINAPLGVAPAGGQKHGLVASTLVRMSHGEKQWHGVDEPLKTVCAGANHHALVSAFIARHYGDRGGKPVEGTAASDPMPTATNRSTQINLVTGSLIQIGARHGGGDQAVDQPMATMLTTERFALVAAFLVQYYSSGTQDQPLDEPMATIVTKARHGLVTLTIDGDEYAIVDIGMRMLAPRELARAQGFDDSYLLTGTKSQQIARIGNSVCPPLAAAVVGANLTPKRVMAA